MALKHIDGFDFYDTAHLSHLWDTVSETGTSVIQVASGSARTGNGLRFQVAGGIGQGGFSSLTKVVGGTEATMITGFAFRPDICIDGMAIVSFLEGSTSHVDLRITGSPTGPLDLYITRNGTTLETESSSIQLDQFHYIELKATVHDSTGAYEVRLNGQTVMSGTNVDTRNGGSGFIDRVAYGPLTGHVDEEDYDFDYDDLYICDTTGSLNNNFLGDIRVDALYPNGAGNSTQWTPNAGSNFQNVDEAPSDGDSTFNASSTASQIDLFTMTNLSVATSLVHGIRELVEFRKDDAGSRTIRHVLRTASTNYESGDVGVGDSYLLDDQLRETNPNTSVAWTESDVNGLEAGYKMQA